MLNWILNLIGIVAYFIRRFTNRKNKTKGNWNFWLKDNWPELSQTFLVNIGLMLILMMPEAQVLVDKFFETQIPLGISIPATLGKAIVSFMLGLGLTALIYFMFQNKTKR